MGSQNTAQCFLFKYYFSPQLFYCVGTEGFFHNHVTSAERTSPRRYGRASHHSLTVSSSCWLAGTPEDTRQPDIGTGRYAHTDVHRGRCRLHEKGCQSFLLCCFSLTCLIQSKTVSKSDRRRKKGKKRRRERKRLPPSFHRYESVHAAASKIKLPFSVW